MVDERRLAGAEESGHDGRRHPPPGAQVELGQSGLLVENGLSSTRLCDFITVLATHKDFRTGWLLLLLRDGSSYGYELRRELRLRELELDPAVMYRTLREMESDGLISSHWTDSSAGPRRRVYRITAEGREQLTRIAAGVRLARDAQSAFLDAYAGLDAPELPNANAR